MRIINIISELFFKLKDGAGNAVTSTDMGDGHRALDVKFAGGGGSILSVGDLLGTDPIQVASGTGCVLQPLGVTVSVKDATTSQKGAVQLSNLYNGTSQTKATTEKALTDGLATKENTLTKGNVSAGSTKISIGGSPTGAVIGSGVSVDVNEANFTLNNIGGTLGISKGGTGQTTANDALNALLPSQSGKSGKYLRTDGTNTSWEDSAVIINRARARRSTTQSISNDSWTKLQLATEDFDTNTEYDNATNYRFTAKTAGYYQVNAAVQFTSDDVTGDCIVAIYKNGSRYSSGYGSSYGTWLASYQTLGAVVADIVYLAVNDYIEIYVYQDSGATRETITTSGEQPFFSIHRLS